MCQVYDFNQERQQRRGQVLNQGQVASLVRYNEISIHAWQHEDQRRLSSIEAYQALLGIHISPQALRPQPVKAVNNRFVMDHPADTLTW